MNRTRAAPDRRTLEEITIVLPLPPKVLHPNTRAHWAQKGRQTAQYRLIAHLAGNRYRAPMWKCAEVHATFYHATNRVRDSDGALASLKAAFDGFADAGIIANDSGFKHKNPTLAVDKKNPRVVITIRPLEEA